MRVFVIRNCDTDTLFPRFFLSLEDAERVATRDVLPRLGENQTWERAEGPGGAPNEEDAVPVVQFFVDPRCVDVEIFSLVNG